MYQLFFSFSGRIGRLQYFLTGLGSIALIIATATFGIMSIGWKQNPVAGVFGLIGLVLILLILCMWSNLSLQARRIRDIGWDPMLVIGGDVVIHVLLHLAARTMGHPSALITSPLTIVYGAVLLFWPGRDTTSPLDLDAIFGDEPHHAAQTATFASAEPSRLDQAGAHARPRIGGGAAAPRQLDRPAKAFGRRGGA